jgi:hypothetical protein
VLGTRSHAKAALVDSQRANTRFERGPRDSEVGGRARGAVDTPARCAQGFLDHRLLLRGESARQLERAVGRSSRRQPALVDRELVRLATITDRSMTSCNSRTFPGHGYD